MFGKDDVTTTSTSDLNSILGKGSNFNGTINVQGMLRIDSDFEGTLECSETVVISKTARVKAEIKAKNIVVTGRVVGKITASEKIELQRGAHVQADLVSPRVSIEEGVLFDGRCRMGEVGLSDGKAKMIDLPKAVRSRPY